MARETKFGLLFVLVLTGTFGMLVYKRLHQPRDLQAVVETKEDGDQLAASDASPPSTDPAAELLVPQQPESAPTTLVNAGDKSPAATPLRPTSPALGNPALPADTARVAGVPVTTSAQPAGLPEDDFFSPPQSPSAPVDADPFEASPAQPTAIATRNPAPAEEDPFGFSAPASSPAMTTTPQPAAAEPAENAAFDPFADPVPTNSSPAASSTVATKDPEPEGPAISGTRVSQEADPFADEPAMTAAPMKTEVAADEGLAFPDDKATSSPEMTAGPVNPSLPVEVPDESMMPATDLPEDDPFAAAPTSQPMPAADSPIATLPKPVDAPQTVELAVPTPVPAKDVPSQTVAVPEVVEADPFDEPPAKTPAPVRMPVREFDEPVAALEETAPVAATPVETVPIKSPAPTPATLDFSEEELGGFRPVKVSESAAASTTVVERRGDPLSGDEMSTAPAATSVNLFPAETAAPASGIAAAGIPQRPLPTGDRYEVQPSDNYWTISKRVYGTGRYFQALAKHNVALAADPQKLKPGMIVATPPANQLEQLYRADIPLAAAPVVQDLQTRRPERYEPDQEPGFFVDASGQPMYRVGSTDTLSSIARNHLGRSSRWVQIYQMNRDILKDGNTLSIGATLKLPGDASQVQVVGSREAIR